MFQDVSVDSILYFLKDINLFNKLWTFYMFKR